MKTGTKFAGIILGTALTVTLTACDPPSSRGNGGNNNYYSYSSSSKPKITVKNFVGETVDNVMAYVDVYGAGDDSIKYCRYISENGKSMINYSNWMVIGQEVKGDTIYLTCRQIIDYGEIADGFVDGFIDAMGY